MTRSPFWSVALGLLMLAVPAAHGRGSADDDTEPKKAKKAATPEQAVKYLTQAAAAGDLDAFMGQLDKRSRDAMKAHLAYADALLKFFDVVDDQLGKDAKMPKPPPFKEILKGFKKIEIIKKDSEEDDRVVLTLKMTARGPDGKPRTGGNKMTAVKEGDNWKLRTWDVLAALKGRPKEVELTSAESRKQQEYFAKSVVVIKRVTRQVEDGKFKSRKTALEGLRGAMMKAFPPPDEDADEP
ncbi:MAG TPA: hypothetical protein VG013_13480 [Gemmataceae bacterium]|nr:hypothetical protein [Gemmataceae bacterium]